MNMLDDNFAIFILTHGRPKNIKTISALKKHGYTGRLYLIIDNEDKYISKYKVIHGLSKVIVFDKKAMADKIDEGNNFDERRTITHARNACFEIAEKLGLKYFLQLDDDYTAFEYRIDEKSENNRGIVRPIKNLDKIIGLFLDYYKNIPALSIAFSQGGDFIGGINNGKGAYRFNKRKCMNSFFCSVDRTFTFVGAMNEDVNTYTTLGSRGNLFLTIPFVSIVQTQTQNNKGGITDMYLRFGTYCKAFTTVLMQPSSVFVSMMNSNHKRIHHSINWANTTPMIIDEKYKK
jgi:hypothetical protein